MRDVADLFCDRLCCGATPLYPAWEGGPDTLVVVVPVAPGICILESVDEHVSRGDRDGSTVQHGNYHPHGLRREFVR
jgi:hypothetical protein